MIMHSHGYPSLVLSDITLDSPTDSLTVFRSNNAHWPLRTLTSEFCRQNINMSNLSGHRSNNYESEIRVKQPVRARCKILYAMERRARFSEMKSPAYYFSVAQARACVLWQCCVDCSTTILFFMRSQEYVPMLWLYKGVFIYLAFLSFDKYTYLYFALSSI